MWPNILKKYGFIIFIDVVISALITFVSLKSYLLSSGFYAYQDQAWVPYVPVTIGQHPGGLFTPFVGVNSLDVFALFHDFYTFPYYLLSKLISNYLLLQKIFIVYSFMAFLLLLFLGGHLFAKHYFINNHHTSSSLKKQLIVILFVLIAYSNFSIMSLNVDGGTFSESVIFAFFLIAILILYGDYNFSVKFLIIGGIFSLSLFLDASYVPLFILFLLIASMITLFKDRDKSKISIVILSILVSLPVIFYVAESIHLSSNVFVPITRPFNYGYVLSRSSNLNIFMVLIQMGRAWPIIAFGPPTILFYGQRISEIPTIGNLPQILLPGGFLTILWVIAALSITIVAFAALFNRKTWKFDIPVSFAILIFIALTQAMFIEQFDEVIQLFVILPVIGPEIGEVFATPSHLVLMVSFGVVLLYTSLFANMLTWHKDANFSTNKGRTIFVRSKLVFGSLLKKRGFVTFVSFLLIFLVVFAYWQSFDGSYYPDGPLREGNPGGNEVPNAGPFLAHDISSTQLKVINKFISMDQSAKFGFYWPLIQTGGPEGFVSSSTISYIISHNMLGALSSFLKFQGVKYFVAWNLNNTFPFNEEGGLSSFYGINNFSGLLYMLNNTPGLALESTTGGYFIYSVMNFSSSYEANVLIYANAFNYSIIPDFSVLSQANIYPVYILEGSQKMIPQENYQNILKILSPSQISTSENRITLENASLSPYGKVTAGAFSIVTSSSTNIVEYFGNGSINGLSVRSEVPEIYIAKENYVNVSNKIHVLAIVQLFESYDLKNVAKVVDFPYVSSTVLTTANGTYRASATLQGSMAFLNATGSIIKLSSSSVVFINYGYVISLGYLISMLLVAFCLKKTNNLKLKKR